MFQRGQEEAPFQLLVAVILMTFVIIVGLNAMQEAEKQKCVNQTEKAMNDFKLALEKTANNKNPSNVKFNPPGCTKTESFQIKKFDDQRICTRVCETSSSTCVLLRYSTSEVTGIDDKCINIGYDTQFRYYSDGTNECPEKQGFHGTPVDSVQGLEQGLYQFLYSDFPGRTYSVVCSYVKDSGV
ncbi:MAG: hypothetical protein ABIJ74_04420 [archaeon]